MKRLLVTGAAGFIGSNFVRYWCQEQPADRVVALDALRYAGVRANLDDLPQVEFVQADIGQTDLVLGVMKKYRVTHVVNFAAESHNSLALVDPRRFFLTNVVGTQGLCEAARQAEVERFHHVSTCEVYGDLSLEDTRLFTEESPYRPRTPYNASKAGGDHVVRSYSETWQLPITITNCANNYGPFQFPEKLIPFFTVRALQGQRLPLYASTENRREWIHVSDHCRAIRLVLERGALGETYHVGSGVEKSVEEMADIILDHLGASPSLKMIVPDRPGHDRRYVLDFTKIQKQLGWTPGMEFDDGVRSTIEWYRNNYEWWRPLMGLSPVREEEQWGKE